MKNIKYKSTFVKCLVPNYSGEVFVIKKVKILFHGYM